MQCRRYVAERLEELCRADPEGWIVLLADELVANAIEAGTDHLEIAVEACPLDTIRVSVIDDAAGLPVLQAPGPHSARGRGLHLVDCLASAWGTRPVSRGKETWFEYRAVNRMGRAESQ